MATADNRANSQVPGWTLQIGIDYVIRGSCVISLAVPLSHAQYMKTKTPVINGRPDFRNHPEQLRFRPRLSYANHLAAFSLLGKLIWVETWAGPGHDDLIASKSGIIPILPNRWRF